ncbi:MAG: DUF3536 domain-containing protein [Deltaproteobacteria bacterium]|nr:MAG: DUF3536 domain-containing protein [Deltaproteobacteria bacterium]
MERYICIHGHFYQPPRENPWLETIELQDSAYPYHDWNERITAEAYSPNATSRILDGKGWIVDIVNNYTKMSFNFGPTLLGWMEVNAPELYESVLEADRAAQARFSGHGSALAQAYNHMILPLANRRDKYTQILWGIRDFETRFGRAPEGMWLPETGVDLESLDLMAELGIRFTILAPHQARRVRPLSEDGWRELSGASIDTTMAYTLELPSGRNISLFFYDGSVSRAVAFEGLLSNGDSFAQRLLDRFSESSLPAQLVHLATDGETYGHHHRFGDMALAYATNYIESKNLARLTNYGEYLANYPPTHEVLVIDDTSWSCAHGVERWRSDCGCNSGGRPGWNQSWRTPLRKALDWLRDQLEIPFEQSAGLFLKDPWEARNEYIRVIMDRSSESVEEFFRDHAVRPLNEMEKTEVLKLLELQRHAMLMYTSCGWFFDDLSGIETIQIIQYAGRAVQLAEQMFGEGIEQGFVERLAEAKSNNVEYGDGHLIYKRFVKSAMVDLAKVGAHYAVSSLFEDYPERTQISCYTVDREDYRSLEAGRAKLALGRIKVTTEITRESANTVFCVLHFGDHNLKGGVREYSEEDGYEKLVQEATEAFNKGDLTETIRIMDHYFEASTYSIQTLFRDEQRKILDIILASTLADAEANYRRHYEYNAPLLRFLKDSDTPPPRALYTAAEFVLNVSLQRALAEEELNLQYVQNLLEEAKLVSIPLDTDSLEMALRRRSEGIAERLLLSPSELPILRELDLAIEISGLLPFKVNLRKIQNVCYDILRSFYPHRLQDASRGDPNAREWVELFGTTCERLSIFVAGTTEP